MRKIFKWIGTILGIIFLVFVFSTGFCCWGFARAAGLNLVQIGQKIRGAYSKSRLLPEKTTFLLLGLDKRSDRLEQTLLTDTIIFASLNLQTGQLKMVSLPRDLWLKELKTKINALYYYGPKTAGTKGLVFTKEKVAEVLAQPIDYVLVLDYHYLGELVDLLGGIEVFIAKAFSDEKFPNPEFGKSPVTGIPRYLTVSFPAGQIHLNGQRVLEFVRSRASENEGEGSDLSRSRRQQLVFKALLAKLQEPKIIFDYQKTAKFYRFWQEKIETNFTDEDLLAILLKMGPRFKIEISQLSIPATFQKRGAILVHPPVDKYGQWVFEPQAGNWEELQKFIKENLK